MKQTMFERYGGFAVVSRIVSEFYDRAIDSKILGPYFDDVDTARLIDHQTKFVASMMGGPASYTNEHLDRVHKPLGITSVAFGEMCSLFRETLEDYELDETDIATVLGEIRSRKVYIVHAE